MRSRNFIAAALPAALIIFPALAGLSGCAQKVKSPVEFPGSGPIVNPFVPATMTIHPLTRVDRDPAGKMWIYCHIEFKDSWGDTVKAAGSLQIQLYRPIGGRASGPGKQELIWNVDLSDLEKNASLFDPATRTYRLPLENPPSWLAQPAATTDAPKARLKAVFTTSGARSGSLMLEDEFALVG